MTSEILAKAKYFFIALVLTFSILVFNAQRLWAQCTTNHVIHRSGSVVMNGITVKAISKGLTDSLNYCPSTFPYLIGATFPVTNSGNGGFTFAFSPAVDMVTLNFSGISYRQNMHEEDIVITVNGSHYSIPSAGVSNGCNPLAVLTASGDIRGCENCTTSGWSGTTITGPIDSITILDSVVMGLPNGSLFSLFFCGKYVPPTPIPTSLQVAVYPNPFHDILNVMLNENRTAEIVIYDITGRKIFAKAFTRSALINISNIADGVYVYKITSEKNILKTGKLIKL